MRNWYSTLIYKFKQIARYLLLPPLLLILLICTIDSLRAPGLPADFAQQRLHTIDGRDLTLAELSSTKPLVVWFWERWCSACRDTIPLMIQLNGKRTSVLTIASHSGNDINVVRYLNGQHLRLPVVNDSRGDLVGHWQVHNTPTLLIVAHGKVICSSSGWTSDLGIWLRLWWVREWHY